MLLGTEQKKSGSQRYLSGLLVKNYFTYISYKRAWSRRIRVVKDFLFGRHILSLMRILYFCRLI